MPHDPLDRRTFLEGSATTLGLLGLARPSHAQSPNRLATGLVGHWPLVGDCRDHSGSGLDGVNHGVRLEDGTFDGRDSHIEIPRRPGLDLGTGDFSLALWARTAEPFDDVRGDLVSQFDPAARRGFHLTMKATGGGYNGQGDARCVHFSIDNAQTGAWQDCGRPNPTSNYVSNSLTAFDGALYAATTDAQRHEDWAHVYRYAGGQDWEDCGRVGDRRTHGVGPLVVHGGQLYAATWNYDWTRAGHTEPLDDFCRVYRYAGGQQWTDCGQPGECRRLFGIATYRGGLYVAADDGGIYRWDGNQTWSVSGRMPRFAHPLAVHDGRLYAGALNPAGVWSFEGADWALRGNPLGSEERCNQIHALASFGGKLHATTWPEGHVCRLEADGQWTDLGRLGETLEINALADYNGKLYAGTIPAAEVFRYDGPNAWTRLRRFHEPRSFGGDDLNDWARVTSLSVFGGRLFASLGSCTASVLDAPADVRGTVWSWEAGKTVSHERDLGPGWKHLAAIRRGGQLELYVDGRRQATSTRFDPSAYDLTCGGPLRIGRGELDGFSGQLRDVRFYRRGLEAAEVAALAKEPPAG